MKFNFLPPVCVAVVCTVLALGLWPLHAPLNEVSWLPGRNGIRFGRHGTVTSAGFFHLKHAHAQPGASLEIWLQPTLIWYSGTFLSLSGDGNVSQFLVRQVQMDLFLEVSHPAGGRTRLWVKNAFHRYLPAFITITSGERGAWVFVDGALVAAQPQFPLSAGDFDGRLVLGDAQGQTDSWSGQIFGFAVYDRQLTGAQACRHYEEWRRGGQPDGADGGRPAALYLFDEHAGNTIRGRTASAVDLHIPSRYTVVNQKFLEPIWSEFSLTHDYAWAALKNVVGFIPLGFCFYAWFRALSLKRAALFTVVIGTAVSLTIEVLQAFLPTRDSGTTDIVTNTFGTWLGVAGYNLVTPVVKEFFAWMPVPRR